MANTDRRCRLRTPRRGVSASSLDRGASEDHTDVWFNFIAHCCLFEALTYHMVTPEMVCLIRVTGPSVLQLSEMNKGNMN